MSDLITQSMPNRRVGPNGRRGVLLVAALVCMLVVVSIVVSMVQNALVLRRELLIERDRRQADVLLMAGAARAATQLGTSAGFRGDVWELPAALIVSNGNGRVRTDVAALKDGQGWNVEVVAEYPLGRDFPIRRSHTFHIASAQSNK